MTTTTADQPDLVNHPPHYTAHPSGVECITVVEHMGFNLGNAIKYIWRADEKGNALEDLRKAAWYVNREIEKRQREARVDCCMTCGKPLDLAAEPGPTDLLWVVEERCPRCVLAAAGGPAS